MVFRKSKSLFIWLCAYLLLVGWVLSVSVGGRRGVEIRREVRVDITDFRPPEVPEMSEAQAAELSAVDAAATAILDQANESVAKATDPAAEASELAEQLSADLDVSEMDTTLTLPGDDSARQSENDAILASLRGLGGDGTGATESKGKGKRFTLPGPPGLKRGASLLYRLTPTRRRAAVKKYGGNKKTEEAVDKALEFLASKQNTDGSWGCRESRKTGDIAALSGLAMLSFLGRGEHIESEYGEVVSKGLDYLLSIARSHGVKSAGQGFGHAILI